MNTGFEFLNWGEIDYELAWKQQQTLFNKILNQKKSEENTDSYLVFCRHPHVYTLGKSGDENNLLIDYIRLQAEHAQFVRTDRGGDITYHGPGQLVGYPIFDLEKYKMGLKQYIFTLETCIIDLLALYGIKSERLAGAAGVWLDTGTKNVRKICAIGVRSSRFVTMHGFALNISTDLNYFNHINPCGFSDKGVTSLSIELGEKINFENLENKLLNIFQKYFSA